MSRTKKHQKTREEILDSAWDLISRNGADASIAEIAVSAGISRQSVYLHFGTRGGLLVALVRRADERFSIKDDLFRAMETPNPRARLSAVISVWLEFVPRIYPVAKDLIRLRATDKDAFCAWEDRMGELKLWLTQLTRSLMADGALADGWTASDASDYLWAGSSVQMWGLLVEECGWAPDRAAHKIRAALVHELMDAPCPDGPT